MLLAISGHLFQLSMYRDSYFVKMQSLAQLGHFGAQNVQYKVYGINEIYHYLPLIVNNMSKLCREKRTCISQICKII